MLPHATSWGIVAWGSFAAKAGLGLLAMATVVFGGFIACAHAADLHHAARVGVLADWSPYYITRADYQPDGFAVDVFNAVSRAGVVPNYRVSPHSVGMTLVSEHPSKVYPDIQSAIHTRWDQPPRSFWSISRIIIAGLILLALVSTLLLAWRYRSIQHLNRQLIESSQLLGIIDGLLMSIGLDSRINFVNAGAERITGWRESELLGQDVFEKLLAPPSFEEARQGVKMLLEGNTWTGELIVARRDGTQLPVMLSASPILDTHGQVRGFAAFAADLSGYKLLESQLMQAQRMDAMGRLAGGIAHDFNNLLTVIKGEIEFAMEQLPGDAQPYESLLSVDRATESATALTRRLLAFSRQQALQPQVLDPRKVVSELSHMLARILKEHISLTVTADDAVWPILVDRGQLEQAIMNLVVNASDAMPNGGAIAISVTNVRQEAAVGDPVDRVCIAVIDTGTGMEESVVERVFEPFFSTKPPGQGTGLGLAIVHGIVLQSGGEISIVSQVGAGTTVSMSFPRTLRHARSDEVTANTPVIVPSDKSILVVEDQVAVRRLICRTLSRDGCNISEAESPFDALALVEDALRAGRPFDLLVTDYMMPDMTGAELAAHVLQRAPGMPVLYLTGYTDGSVVIEGDGQQLMTKPFSGRDLRHKVREMLG